jgi:hypothetical protein
MEGMELMVLMDPMDIWDKAVETDSEILHTTSTGKTFMAVMVKMDLLVALAMMGNEELMAKGEVT